MKNTLASIVAKNVLKFRKKAAISQLRLCNNADIDLVTLYDIEHGKGNPEIGTLSKISKALEIPISHLFEDDQENPKRSSLLTSLAKYLL